MRKMAALAQGSAVSTWPEGTEEGMGWATRARISTQVTRLQNGPLT